MRRSVGRSVVLALALALGPLGLWGSVGLAGWAGWLPGRIDVAGSGIGGDFSCRLAQRQWRRSVESVSLRSRSVTDQDQQRDDPQREVRLAGILG